MKPLKNHVTILLAALATLMLGACAPGVDQKLEEAQAETNKKIESILSQVEDLQQKQKTTDTKIEALSQESREALRRAQEAGVLAKGKVVFEQAFSEDRVKFDTNSADLDKGAKGALDEFAGRVKALTEPVFIEIQGHTDSTGGAVANETLGGRRADAVRRYLNKQHQLPLNRMSTISYGDTLPLRENKTRDGRAANRRVVLVVLE